MVLVALLALSKALGVLAIPWDRACNQYWQCVCLCLCHWRGTTWHSGNLLIVPHPSRWQALA
jgi:hypothetical protein